MGENRIYVCWLLLCLTCLGVQAQQSLEQGFSYLEEGKLDEAEAFFERAISQEPDSKTARLCYGRAVGLQGETERAMGIFEDLLTSYPGDFELLLNKAEAHMWMEDYVAAEKLYANLVSQKPADFVANLGYANALTSLGNHVKSLEYIKKCIEVNPYSESALVSKKYILLANASELRDGRNYGLARDHLLEVLSDFPEDREALINLAIVELHRQKPRRAQRYYHRLLPSDPYESALGLSSVSLILGRKKEALSYAEDALRESRDAGDIRADIQYLNCLGAMGRFSKADTVLHELEDRYPKRAEVTLAKGRLRIWDQEYQEGFHNYARLDTLNGFEVLLGLAEAERALGNRTAAIQRINRALQVQPQNLDAERLREAIYREGATSFELAHCISTDASGVWADISSLKLGTPIGERHRLLVSASSRGVRWQSEGSSIRQSIFELGDEWRASRNTNLRASVGLANSSNNSPRLLFGASVDQKIGKYQGLGARYYQELHNYTPELVASGITMNHFLLSYSYSRQRVPGLYAQLMHTRQSDGNKRNLQFASLYYGLRQSPSWKAGLNFLRFSFSESVPELYFSPDRFLSFEVFTQADNLYVERQRFKYIGLLAIGQQWVEDNARQNSLRLEAKLGYRMFHEFLLYGFYQYSSASQTSTLGFKSSRFGLCLEGKLYKVKKPEAASNL